jgi:hypothetical protein
MPTNLPPPPVDFWKWAGRTVAGVAARLLLLLALGLTRAGLILSRRGVPAAWLFRRAWALLDAATWLRPDPTAGG